VSVTLNQIEAGLRTLRSPAPDPVLREVLVGVGVADSYVRASSPIGELFVAASARGITRVAKAGDAAAFAKEYRARFGRAVFEAARVPRHLRPLVRGRGLVKRSPRSTTFDLSSCSEFERAVLQKALEIPEGEVRPYGWIAREIGNPRAVRAVGTALGNNPIPLLIPCHRVVRSDGRIGEYALGSSRKRALLAGEGLNPGELERLASSGARFVASHTTGIFCYPTCHNAKRIAPSHRVPLRSVGEADRRGFRACRACRPAGAA